MQYGLVYLNVYTVRFSFHATSPLNHKLKAQARLFVPQLDLQSNITEKITKCQIECLHHVSAVQKK